MAKGKIKPHGRDWRQATLTAKLSPAEAAACRDALAHWFEHLRQQEGVVDIAFDLLMTARGDGPASLARRTWDLNQFFDKLIGEAQAATQPLRTTVDDILPPTTS